MSGRGENGGEGPSFVAEFDPAKERESRLSKRFYKTVQAQTADDGYSILLDDRDLKTPGRRLIVLPTESLADAIAGEWEAQTSHIDPSTMPRTRIATTAIDRVAEDKGPAVSEIVSYAGTDLVCYRADDPVELVDRQAAAWDPLLEWIRVALSVHLVSTSGIIHVDQDAAQIQHLDTIVSALDPLTLTALHTLVTIAGSTVVGLAILHGRLTAREGFDVSRIDEQFQIDQWGEDAEAAARAKAYWEEFEAAAEVLTLLA